MQVSTITIDGTIYELHLVRRRYSSRQTFTTVSMGVDGTFYRLGDEWPCIVPKRAEIEAAARAKLIDLGKLNAPRPSGQEQGF